MLDGVSPQQANTHPLASAHSIAEIVGHVTSTIDLVTSRLRGVPTELTPDEDWPTVSGRWEDAIIRLETAHQHLLDAVARMSPEQLDAAVVEKNYTAHVMLDGIIHHNLYHAGQIALLKKAV